MTRTVTSLAVGLLALLAACGGTAHAGEVSPPVTVREGWTTVSGVPAWVRQPPPRAGAVRLVDGAQSNLPELTYPDPGTQVAVRNVRLMLLVRLAPVLGVAARAPAEAGAKAATAVEKAIHVQRPESRARPKPGDTVCTAFVLWDVPLDPVLAAVPEEQRAAASAALRAEPLGHGVAWAAVEAEPAWVKTPPTAPDRLRIVTTRADSDWNLALAMTDINLWSFVRSAIQRPLRPVLGSDLAFEVGVMASGSRRLLKRARDANGKRAWQLWEVPLDAILAYVPEEQRAAARAALVPTASGTASRDTGR